MTIKIGEKYLYTYTDEHCCTWTQEVLVLDYIQHFGYYCQGAYEMFWADDWELSEVG